jgi:hypothetical protein
MFPNVRLMIAAVVASVVALSCGFALFAAFRVNHEPLSRLATGPAPLQLAAGNPIPSVGPPAPADSFGNRFPLHQADGAGASPEATPQQPDHDDSVEPPSAVATTTTATVPEAESAEPAQPAPVAQAPVAEPDAKPDEVAATPSEPPPPTPSEPPPAATETAATEPPAEPAASAEPVAPTAPTQQASQEPNQEPNPDTKPATATTAAAAPAPLEAHPKAAHRHHLAAKAQRARQARAIAPPGNPGIGGPLVLLPNRSAARPQRTRQVRAPVQPVSQPSGIGGTFVPPTTH